MFVICFIAYIYVYTYMFVFKLLMAVTTLTNEIKTEKK